jgi:F0F1-type ATP synthase membrane subunit b/b'
LAQESIQAIREAENTASVKEKEAKAKAIEIVDTAKKEAEEMIKARIDAARKEGAASLENASAQNESIITKAKEEATAEIAKLKEAVSQKENDAVKAIVDALI